MGKLFIFIALIFVVFSCTLSHEKANKSPETLFSIYKKSGNGTSINYKMHGENYIISKNFYQPKEKQLKANYLYLAKLDNNNEIIYEFRVKYSVENREFQEYYINGVYSSKEVPQDYYINIIDKRTSKCLSHFIGNFIINEKTTLIEIENLYQKHKDSPTNLCCSSEGKDWKYLGTTPIEIVDCSDSDW